MAPPNHHIREPRHVFRHMAAKATSVAFRLKTEEKGSDVNLAVHMVNDAWSQDYECLAIISNDSDLAEAMRIVKHERKRKVALIAMPKQNIANKLKTQATFVRTAQHVNFKKNQLPATIPGTPYSKPLDW